MIEITIGIVVIIFLYLIFGRTKIKPNPNEMTTDLLQRCLEHEKKWIINYLLQPPARRNSTSLKNMYDEKIKWRDAIQSELATRQSKPTLEEAIEEELQIIKDDLIKKQNLTTSIEAKKAAFEASFKVDKPASRPGFEMQRSFFGGEIEVDRRTEEEKFAAMKIGLANMMKRDLERMKEELDVDISTAKILKLISEGEATGTAFHQICGTIGLSVELRRNLLREVEEKISNGLTCEVALKSTLEKFKSS